MKVILLQDVRALGQKGEIIEVADGFGRNYLIPVKLAKFADQAGEQAAVKDLLRKQKRLQSQSQKAKIFVSNLPTKTFRFDRPADEKGHLYAGLREDEILDKLAGSDTKLIDYTAIKTLGEHNLRLKIGKEYGEIKIIVQKKS